jgi:hypothetical protein
VHQPSRPLRMAALAENVFQRTQIRRERDDERWPRSCDVWDVWGTGVVRMSLGSSRVGSVQRATASIARRQCLTVSAHRGATRGEQRLHLSRAPR